MSEEDAQKAIQIRGQVLREEILKRASQISRNQYSKIDEKDRIELILQWCV
jgi:hypothetical protein